MGGVGAKTGLLAATSDTPSAFLSAERCRTPAFAVHMVVTAVGVLLPPAKSQGPKVPKKASEAHRRGSRPKNGQNRSIFDDFAIFEPGTKKVVFLPFCVIF